MNNSKNSTRTKNPSMQKSVHRTIELPVTSGNVHPHLYPLPELNTNLKTNDCPVPNAGACNEGASKYAKPQLNYALRHVLQIETLQACKQPQYKKTLELTPRSKAAIVPKITQKLNFNTNQTVYKNLPSLNVNDSILLSKKVTPIPKKYEVKTANRLPAPELSDFLDPLPPMQHHIDLPEPVLEFPQQRFNFLEAYKRFSS